MEGEFSGNSCFNNKFDESNLISCIFIKWINMMEIQLTARSLKYFTSSSNYRKNICFHVKLTIGEYGT